MEEKLEIDGFWWLPEDENNKVAGTLYIADNGTYQFKLIEKGQSMGQLYYFSGYKSGANNASDS